ncbi:hypothetical protein B7C42_01998 [Nocardia cerradoensis]|uniref:Low molecular weight antigen MTB12-like C-terminal domain-containing protein n=1 Tax=Nocardia cerradoensis TaxID=85688 RepID=A0A231HAE1_9NOCA|nr:hypothetical protein [Nocardia cerradoensis]OXR45706.1 hypothetical protein B7C42_01998 [Nocardia cerradoensis]
MRNKMIRGAAGLCGIAVIAAATVTGCSDDKSDNASSTTTTTAAAATTSAAAPAAGSSAADPATTKAVTDAYVLFFDAKQPADKRAAAVEKGDVFAPVLAAQAGNPQAQGTSATVSKVTTVDADHADVTYTLLMGGNPVLPDQAGQAVQENGQWKVAATTFCALLKLQGGTAPAC